MLINHIGKISKWYIGPLVVIGIIVRISIIGISIIEVDIMSVIIVITSLRTNIGQMCCWITNKVVSPSIVIVVTPVVIPIIIVIIAIVGIIIIVTPTPTVAC